MANHGVDGEHSARPKTTASEWVRDGELRRRQAMMK